jgi:uncharacterized protein involved in response to NO
MNAVPRLQDYAGPALLSYGFRPFFLLGALYAAIAMLVWLPVFYGELSVPTVFVPRDWHVHELLYGYLPAVITGFLLTAIPNWTGRLPLQGRPLLALVALWLAGRLAVTFSAVLGEAAVALIDASFLLAVAAAAAREIIAGSNWRNLKVLSPVIVLAAGNIGFHAESYLRGSAEISIRAGMAAVLVLIMLIGGRVIPSFTRNWLARENPGRLPAPFGKFDAAAIAFSTLALACWTVVPVGEPTAALLLASAVLQAVRLVRWAGDRTLGDRLVLVLHVAYAFVPVGFLLTGLAAAGLVLPSAGMHCWMAGAAGLMTLAVMTRASLGHTGRALDASPGTQAIYAAAFVAACARVAAVLVPEWSHHLTQVAGVMWIAAFGGFGIVYGPMLLRPRTRQRMPVRAGSVSTGRPPAGYPEEGS